MSDPVCLVCGSDVLTPLYEGVRDRLRLSPNVHRFLRCGACGSATVDPVPRPDLISVLYPEDYTFRHADPGEGPWRERLRSVQWRMFYEPSYRRRLRVLQRLTGGRRGRVLEIGCGSGLFLRLLRDAGYRAEGLEMSERDAARARRLGLAVAHGMLGQADVPDRGYDIVLLNYVLEHVPDPRDAVAELTRLLAPGGWLIVGVPIIDSLQARLLGARWSQVTEAPRHIIIPSFAGALRLLSDAGLTNVNAAPYSSLENAGHIALSVVPAATASAPTSRMFGELAWSIAGGLALALAWPLAWLEQRWPRGQARSGTMLFCGQRV
jgi:SAM-dependent methyltransferase